MIVNKIAKSKLIQFNRIVKTFSGAPKIKYDWRDDHTINPDL